MFVDSTYLCQNQSDWFNTIFKSCHLLHRQYIQLIWQSFLIVIILPIVTLITALILSLIQGIDIHIIHISCDLNIHYFTFLGSLKLTQNTLGYKVEYVREAACLVGSARKGLNKGGKVFDHCWTCCLL